MRVYFKTRRSRTPTPHLHCTQPPRGAVQMLQAALRHGYRFLTTTASPLSRPILARHGFRQLTTFDDYEWKGQPNP